MAVDSAGRVLELGGVRYLNPADQVFEEMLEGWRNQQLSPESSLLHYRAAPCAGAPISGLGQ